MVARRDCKSCAHLRSVLKFTEAKRHGDEFDLRKFDPSTYGYRPDATPNEVLNSDPNCCPVVHARNTDVLRRFAMYAYGACGDNETRQARASVGVYGTRGAWFNKGYLLPSHLRQTNQNAEIRSAIAALEVARGILKDIWKQQPLSPRGHCYTEVLLVMNSRYIVDAMTESIPKWRANGFRTSRGRSLGNMEAFQILDDEIRRLFEDHLVIVRFWHVDRTYNAGADGLAAEAINENSIDVASDSD